MLLEINLVFSQSIYSNALTLIARDRVDVERDDQVLAQISEFIKDHIESFDAAIPDKDLMNRLQTLELTTVSDFYSLKFILANFGLDILCTYVAELEVNPSEISENTTEYNIIDELDDAPSFVKSASKVVVSNEAGDLHTVYSKVIEGFGFFNSELTAGFNNPLTRSLNVLTQSETLIGISPVPVTTEINSILEYLGKKIIAILK
jgi:hypothetical protein